MSNSKSSEGRVEHSNTTTITTATSALPTLTGGTGVNKRRRYKEKKDNISVTQLNQSTDQALLPTPYSLREREARSEREDKPTSPTTLLKEQLYVNATTQRLDKKNISEIFLVQTRKPIKLPTLEVLKFPELPVINQKQEMLTQIAKFKAAKKKAKEKTKLYLAASKKKFIRRLLRNQYEVKEVH